MNNWIEVDNRVPDIDYIPEIYVVQRGKRRTDAYWLRGRGFCVTSWYDDGNGGDTSSCVVLSDVTHWMLPPFLPTVKG